MSCERTKVTQQDYLQTGGQLLITTLKIFFEKVRLVLHQVKTSWNQFLLKVKPSADLRHLTTAELETAMKNFRDSLNIQISAERPDEWLIDS